MANKRASNRLKPAADTVLQLAIGRVTRPIAKEKQLLWARLDRELTQEDDEAQSLRLAVETFWKAYYSEDDKDTLMACASEVARLTQMIKSARWRRIETQYGPVAHYFDEFGQVKPKYRQRSVQEMKPVRRKSSWLLRLKAWLVMLK